MTVKIIVRLLLTFGFIAASVGYSSWTAERTIFDPAATRGATHALLATPAVQMMLARDLRDALRPALGSQALTPKATAAINAAVRDPKFVAAFEDALMNLHENILSGNGGSVTLDTAQVTRAINDAVKKVDPQAARKLHKLKPVRVPLGATGMPHVGPSRDRVRVIGNTAIAIAFLLVGGALLLARDRKTVRRAGRRVAFLAIPPVLVFLLLPHLLVSSHNSALAVGAAILTAYGHRVMLSATLLAIAGISVWLIAIALPRRRTEPATDAARPAPAAVPAPNILAPSHTSAPAAVPEHLYL